MDKLRCDNVRRQRYPERGIKKKKKNLLSISILNDIVQKVSGS